MSPAGHVCPLSPAAGTVPGSSWGFQPRCLSSSRDCPPGWVHGRQQLQQHGRAALRLLLRLQQLLRREPVWWVPGPPRPPQPHSQTLLLGPEQAMELGALWVQVLGVGIGPWAGCRSPGVGAGAQAGRRSPGCGQVPQVGAGPQGGCRTSRWAQVPGLDTGPLRRCRYPGWVQDPRVGAGPWGACRTSGWVQDPRMDPALP